MITSGFVSTRARVLLVIGLVGASLSGLALGTPAARADAPAPFTNPGTYIYVVPAGVSAVTFTLLGAAGGRAGGLGGRVAGTLEVDAGDTFTLNVGGTGLDFGGATGNEGGSVGGGGGYNGGGSGGFGNNGGGGGGGASDVRFGGTSLADRVLVAGGGGGGGGPTFTAPGGGGAGGGATAADGYGADEANGGLGGSGVIGGAGGLGTWATGGSGSLGDGGHGGVGSFGASGGGGGGYYGGGAGGSGLGGAGGGGGSSYFSGAATNVTDTQGVQFGNGSITITETLATPIFTTPTGGEVTAGTSYAAQLTTPDADGAVTYTQTTGSPSLTVDAAGAITAPNTLALGTYTATGTTADEADGVGTWSFTLTVSAPYASTVVYQGAGGDGPTGVAFDPSGNMFVNVENLNILIGQTTKITPSGVATTFVPDVLQSRGVTTDADGNVYIVENHDRFRVLKVTPGGSVSVLPITGLGISFGIVVDPDGNVFVADTANDRVVLLDTSNAQSTLAITGLDEPHGLARDGDGNLYIADGANDRVVKFSLEGVQTTVPTTGLNNPLAVAVNSAGSLLITQFDGELIRVDAAGVQTTVPTPDLDIPLGLAFDADGNIYIAEAGKKQVFKLSPVPVAPTNVTTSFVTPTSVSVAFTPAADVDPPTTQFRAQCTSSTGGIPRHNVGTASPITVVSLTPGYTYTCSVRGDNVNGKGVFSAPSAEFTIAAKPATPTGVTPTVTGTTASVAFTPGVGGGTATQYMARCTSSDGGLTRNNYGTASPINVPSLTPGQTYTCIVTATNSLGTSPNSAPSADFMVAAKPATPTGVTPTVTGTTASVAFTPGVGGGTATQYMARCTSSDGGLTRNNYGTASPINVPSLTPGQTYTCIVTATNSLGTSPNSAPSADFMVAAKPATPTGVTPTVTGTTASVAFTPGVGGGTATQYMARCTSSDGGLTRNNYGTASPINVPSLTPGQTYTCIVTATNSLGTSPNSATSAPFTV